ncbi:ABC transporter permease [Knoellia aerolata DSM 18566]|uniref:ABC transporter permease n=2 Tax=Knoellia TaxID=136099 RepID=A0A0A0JZM4_9MICO|nr:ABC transporter permease [Knoellia aerolata DSM 18566]
MLVILGIFLFIPVVMAFYVSLTSWNGNGSPFTGGENAKFVGVDNYTSLFAEDGLRRQNFMQSIGNNFWFVFFVVPLQTALSFFLAIIVNNKFLKGKGFFRTAFYFPSVTSSIAISVVFIFLFANSGAVNAVLGKLGVDGPAWFSDSRGLFHIAAGGVGVDTAPGFAQAEVFGRSLWDWFSGPSVAMCVVIILVIWTTTGTFMLMFLAALQDVPVEVEEAAMLDGTTGWQKMRHVTVPILKPAFFLVTTLGLIGTWQIFDQIYVMGKGAPANTTLTPAFLSYKQAFTTLDYGTGAAISFVVFALIIALTSGQRWLLRDRDVPSRRKARAASIAASNTQTGARK